MTKSKQRAKKFTKYHNDGTVWAKGQTLNDIAMGYWEWFRKDGTKMRSGSFNEGGNQIGEWTTYDRAGAVVKVTDMNRKRKPKTKT